MSQAILLEAIATAAELVTADELLRGITPWDHFCLILHDYGILRQKKDSRVSPSGGSKVLSLTEVQAERARFCANCMIILAITESASILCTTVYWLALR